MKTIKNSRDLADLINVALPKMSDTGLAKHLRKIKPDMASKGKAVIIWYGCPTINAVVELRVTVALKVRNLSEPWNHQICTDVEKLLKQAAG
jgi:hypothetical protein